MEALVRGGGPARPAHDLGARPGQALARPDVEGHVPPAPGIDLELERRERLDRRGRRGTRLLPVAAKLSADQVLGFERRHGLEYFDLLVPYRFAVRPDRLVHRTVRQSLVREILAHPPELPPL